MKVNVDAVIVQGSLDFATGMVLINHAGEFLGGRTLNLARQCL